ncbi:MAG TPA: 2-oxo acid dehydrogenase subunit E2, partial [Xanthomonadales bacterium]|nr:2-oxo acid dehydrogenase subunit E2 [Xanthomonadales bacterium]
MKTEAAEAVPQAATEPAAATQAEVAAPAGNEKVRTSPSIRRMAREAGVDLSRVAASGPRGRILKQDFEAFRAGKPATPATPAASAAPASSGLRRAVGSTEIKVIGLRRKIAERMEQANREIPQISYVEEIDITALESLRTFLNSRIAAREEKLTPLAFIGMALVRALAEFPQCNAHYDNER